MISDVPYEPLAKRSCYANEYGQMQQQQHQQQQQFMQQNRMPYQQPQNEVNMFHQGNYSYMPSQPNPQMYRMQSTMQPNFSNNNTKHGYSQSCLPSTSEQPQPSHSQLMTQQEYGTQACRKMPMNQQSVSSQMLQNNYQQQQMMMQQQAMMQQMSNPLQNHKMPVVSECHQIPSQSPQYATQQMTMNQISPKIDQKLTFQQQMPEYNSMMAPCVSNVTPDMMKQFLEHREYFTCAITIHVPKAVQKSYKTEKRFLVPPPTVLLSGDGWATSRLISGNTLCDKTFSKATMKITHVDGTEKEMEKTNIGNNKLLLTAKSMFISTDEKKKMITLTTELKPMMNCNIGTIITDRMKVMSKPSKKKQTAIGIEARYLSIKSGSHIALYNRLRSQNISTRFFHVNEHKKFEASSTQWSVLEISLLRSFNDTTNDSLLNFQQESAVFDQKDGYISYGDIVLLTDLATGQSMEPLRIRKAGKEGNAYLTKEDTKGEPVSQLHMVVFETLNPNDPWTYLHANPEHLKFASGTAMQNGSVSVNDGCRWTIISAEAITHRFATLMGPPTKSIGPMPILNVADETACRLDDQAAIEFRGNYIGPNLDVWFGVMKAPKTKIISIETMIAIFPKKETYFATYGNNHTEPLPITLVRDDGIVYSTEFLFEYNRKPCGNIGRSMSVIDYEYEKNMM